MKFRTGKAAPKTGLESESPDRNGSVVQQNNLDALPKTRWQRVWPALACGSGLFSDGYLNGVIGPVNTLLTRIYGTQYTNSSAESNVAAITFAGTVFGQLLFGWTSDGWSRKNSLLVSTIILIVFAILGAGAWGAGGTAGGLFAALTAYRFLLGVGIGGEYPAGSVACAESTAEIQEGHRNRWFILFTNVAIDWGFVVSSLVAMIMVLITTEDHLGTAWRVVLGLGAIPPLSLLYLRIKLQEPEEFKRETLKDTKTPWTLVIRMYWWRLLVVSLIWFIYDFSSYSFGIFSSVWLDNILNPAADPNYVTPLWVSFGWSTVINLFYIPGAMFGALYSDWVGPKYALATGVLAQGLVGFLMSGLYPILAVPKNVGGFVVIYGIFLSLGELGPGDNIGLIASKTSATAVRGRYYAIAAAMGKIGAFVGTYVFPIIIKNAPNTDRQGQDPFFVSSGLCILSALLAFFLLPHIGQDTITHEDARFRAYLIEHGFDTSKLGIKDHQTSEQSIAAEEHYEKA